MNISGPGPMHFEEPATWNSWKQKFEIFLLASGKNEAKEEVKIALLLHYMGEKGIEICNSFNLPEADKKIGKVLERFDSHCIPGKNVIMENFMYHQINQHPE